MNWRSAFKLSRAEAAVFERQNRRDRETITTFPNDHSYRLTLDGVFVKVSEPFCLLLGHDRREFVGKRIDRFTCTDVLDIPKHLGAVFHFGMFRGIWVFQHREGRRIVVRYTGELLPDGKIDCRVDPLLEDFAAS